VWRLGTPILLVWAAGGVATGLLATSLSGVLNRLTAANEREVIRRLQAVLGGNATLEQAFVATFFGIVGVLAACAAMQVAMRARQEEVRGTAEPVLATPISKTRWLLGYWIIGAIVLVVVLSASALAGTVGAAAAADPGRLISTTLQAAAAQLPAGLLFLGVTLILFAWLPREMIPLGWTLLGVTAILSVFGPLFGAPDWLVKLSPFAHSPVPAGSGADWSGGFVMLALAAAAAVAAILSMRRRELASGG
jgi:ABC-2 type transport system permease protein